MFETDTRRRLGTFFWMANMSLEHNSRIATIVRCSSKGSKCFSENIVLNYLIDPPLEGCACRVDEKIKIEHNSRKSSFWRNHCGKPMPGRISPFFASHSHLH